MRSQRIARSVVAALGAILVGAALASARGGAAPAAATSVDFARDVKPILAASCVRCHAAGLAQGQLRLDTRAGLLKGGVSGPVVVPGNGRDSLLYQRLVLDDAQKRMPWLSDPLLPAEAATVRRWIDAGAPWPEGLTVGLATPAAPTLPPPSLARVQSEGPALTFNKDVRPILAANCYACHGPDRNNRQAGLRLDREDVAKTALASGHVAIVPGAPEKSALMERITEPDEQKRMPHVSSGKERLGRAQIDTLRRWIEQGAPWESHWSYIAPVRSPLPAVKNATWAKGALDTFVLAQMEKQGLSPSTEAPRASSSAG